MSLKVSSFIRIEGNEPYFFEHNGIKKSDGTESDATSRGYYYIGIHSYEAVKYSIRVFTKKHNLMSEDGTKDNSSLIDVDPLYLGIQDQDLFLEPNTTKYFYFQNWVDEKLKFSVELLNKHFTSP